MELRGKYFPSDNLGNARVRSRKLRSVRNFTVSRCWRILKDERGRNRLKAAVPWEADILVTVEQLTYSGVIFSC